MHDHIQSRYLCDNLVHVLAVIKPSLFVNSTNDDQTFYIIRTVSLHCASQ